MGAVIVQDNVNDFAGRYLSLDGIEDADELLMSVALHAAADNPAELRNPPWDLKCQIFVPLGGLDGAILAAAHFSDVTAC